MPIESFQLIQTGLLSPEFRGTHGIDVTQEAIGNFRWILWVFVQESTQTVRSFRRLSEFSTWSIGCE